MTEFEKGMLEILDAILAEMKTARQERAALHELKEKDRVEARTEALKWAEEMKKRAKILRSRPS
jgi:hypothetical protein